MKLCQLLELEKSRAVISIVGGGGKTATMFELGRELSSYRVLMTTTTKIMKPSPSPHHRIIEKFNKDLLSQRDIPWVYGISSPEYPGKLTGVTFSFIEEMKPYFDYIIIESDGSAGRPLKAPASHEPVVSPLTDLYIGVIGVDSLFKKGDDNTVHRPELFSKIRNKEISAPLETEDLIKLINHKEGLFKNAPEKCRKIVLLNKSDLLPFEQREKICRRIIESIDIRADLILNSYESGESILFSK